MRERRRLIGSLIFIGHFPQKSPIISGSFAKNDLHLRHPMGLRHPVIVHICVYILYTSMANTCKYMYTMCTCHQHVGQIHVYNVYMSYIFTHLCKFAFICICSTYTYSMRICNTHVCKCICTMCIYHTHVYTYVYKW